MNIICIGYTNPSGSISGHVPTVHQSAKLDRAIGLADYFAARFPKNIIITVRHHRSGECFYEVRGIL